MLLKYSGICISLIFPMWVSAQDLFQEEPVRLKEVRVTSTRLREFAVGASVTSPDSSLMNLHQEESLSSLLSAASGIDIKTYGVGGLTSLSMRGGRTNHTAVLWNGLNIQSPMNGGVNLSVMPVRFFNHVEVQRGGSGTLFGSGAVSGVIHLSGKDLLGMKNGLNVSASTGSFGFGAAAADVKMGNSGFAGRLAVFGQQADNDFSFINTSRIGHPKETQTNAGVEQYGVLQENQWRISDRSMMTTGLWFQDYNKDLQTLMTSRQPDDTNQKDKNFLVSANFKYYGQRGTFQLKQGLIRNKVLYSNPDYVDPQADNNSRSWISEAEYKYRVGVLHSINAGVNYTNELAWSDGYIGDVTRHRLSAFVSGRYGWANGRGAAVLSVREELTNGNEQPVVFSLGLEHPLVNWATIKGTVSKNYRIPNLNDLYWKDDGYSMGNLDLKAEAGWSGDMGIDFSFSMSETVKTEVTTALFASRTNDIIVWLPEDGGKWMPRNKQTGETLGVEAGLQLTSQAGVNTLAARVFYTYVSSTLTTDDEYNGQQMIYTPKHKVNTVLSFACRPFYVTLSGVYTGERYYDYKNTLEAYTLLNGMVGYKLKLLNVGADLSFKVNNITDTAYQVVAWYAMPPRNYRITLSLTI